MAGDIVIDSIVWQNALTDVERDALDAWLAAEGHSLDTAHGVRRVNGRVLIAHGLALGDGGFERMSEATSPLPPLPSIDDRMVVLPPHGPGESVLDVDEFHKTWDEADRQRVLVWVAANGVDPDDCCTVLRIDDVDWIVVWDHDADGYRCLAQDGDGSVHAAIVGHKVRASPPCPLPQRVG